MKQKTFDSGHPFISSFHSKYDLEWEMSRAEKYALIDLLKQINPKNSIEIGTYKGGSLQVISNYSDHVYSVDISGEPKRTLEKKFQNVEFLIGKSVELLPSLFQKIEDSGEELNFILVDGDHSKLGVYKDLRTILEYPHKSELTILVHDSFNPQSRKGIKMIDFSKYDNIEYVELDYIHGNFWHNKTFREMWGGFALIKLGQSGFSSGIQESAKKAFQTNYLHSMHMIKDVFRIFKPLQIPLYKIIGRKHKSEKYQKFE